MFSKEEEKHHLLAKTLIYFLVAPLKLPVCIIVRFLILIDVGNLNTSVEYGCFDSDNIVSTIIYAISFYDAEPSWGDYPSRESDHERGNTVQRKFRKEVSKGKHQAIAPYVVEGDGKTKYPADVLAQAKNVAKYCSSNVWEYGNKMDINVTASLRNSNTIVFTFTYVHSIKKDFKSKSDLDSFQNHFQDKVNDTAKNLHDMMQKWFDVNIVEGEYSIDYKENN